MKAYEINSIINFGKYENFTLENISKIDPDYINWCINNLDHFYISEEVISEISTINPIFKVSEDEINILNNKLDSYYEDSNSTYYEDNDWNNSWDSEYYNDSLDMDQQSPEFWDSI